MSSSTMISPSSMLWKVLLPFSDSLLLSHQTLLYFRSSSCIFQLKFHKMNGLNPPQFVLDLLPTLFSPPPSSLLQHVPLKHYPASSNTLPFGQMEDFLKKNEAFGVWGGLEWGEVNLNKEDLEDLEIFFLKKEKLSNIFIMN